MDPIADFLIRIKNASYAGKESVTAPFSKVKLAIAENLAINGFLGEVSTKGKTAAHKHLHVALLYETDGQPKIREIKRTSKPSRRLYEKTKDIKSYRRGFGLAIFSTPKGIMTDMEARKAKVGGEKLFTIW